MKIKKLGLTKGKEDRLLDLIENQKILEVIRLKYFPKKIDIDLKSIDEKIDELLVERKEIIEDRQKVSTQKLNELNRSLEANKKEQLAIIMRSGNLAKLAKLVKIVKKINV